LKPDETFATKTQRDPRYKLASNIKRGTHRRNIVVISSNLVSVREEELHGRRKMQEVLLAISVKLIISRWHNMRVIERHGSRV